MTATFSRLKTAVLWLLGVLAAALLAAQPAFGQAIKPLEIEPDVNGVDVLSGKIRGDRPALEIPAAGNLRMDRIQDFFVQLFGTTQQSGEGSISVNVGATSDSFSCFEQGSCISVPGNGSVVVGFVNSSGGSYSYTQGGSGTKVVFDTLASYLLSNGETQFTLYPSTVTWANGEQITFNYDTATNAGQTYYRPDTIVSNLGYTMELTYQSNTLGQLGWGTPATAEIYKTSAPSTALAEHTYSGSNVTDLLGRTFVATAQSSLGIQSQVTQTQFRLPGTSVDQLNATSGTSPVTGSSSTATLVDQVTRDGMVYDYDYTIDSLNALAEPLISQVVITGPSGYERTVDITPKASNRPALVTKVADSQGRETEYDYEGPGNSSWRLLKITLPEGNSVEVDYDDFGNITEKRTIAKPGSGQANLVQTATFPTASGCNLTVGAYCFLPTSTTDAKGNTTDYTFSQTHGGLLTQLDPANEQNRRRKIKNTYAQAPGGVWRMTQTEVCETDLAGTELTCGTAQSFVTQTTYLGDTMLPLTTTATDGAGNAPLTTSFTYDDAGRLLSSDGPLAGRDDATYARYDVIGRKIWEIGPKGENGLRPATKTTYRDADDQVLKVETGTVAGTTAATSPTTLAFVEAISVAETEYNTRRLAVKSTVSDASTNTYGVTQMSYDARNREDCTATRMNAAEWSSLPTSACTHSTAGSEGADRISKKHYDTESRVTRIEQGLGTSLVRDYATYTFTPNGQMASMTDARGYKASMNYDGFDRQTHWYFPSKTATGAINPADYEQYTYDANGNRTTLRKRDGSVLSFTYDKLNRVTKKAVPTRAGLDTTHTRDVFYRYDIRGLQTHAKFDSIGGAGLATYYDRYGRVTRNWDKMDGVNRNLYYYYDAAGNRTRLRYPDARNVYYTYSSGGQFDQVKDNGSVVIADYNYNNRGELSQINRDSTAPDQDWTYDPIGRLASTGWANGGANNVSWAFTRNPASQIKTETQTNDAFSWDGHADVTRSYTANGLNQYTSVSGQSYCYDDNGNLTRDDQYAYQYDVENRLVEMRELVAGACPTNTSGYTGQLKAKLRYDPLGRLHEVENFVSGVAQGPTRFLYDGDALVAEYNASNTMLARYIHGPAAGADDPIAEYTGGSVAASARTNLYADARGSIVMRTASDGTSAQINTYDEYGIPSATNTGRFQYTGQVYLAELGMHYYKARIYSPTLGRFLQTDPIGYEDSVNLYGYVGNDPMNGIDPTGMAQVIERRSQPNTSSRAGGQSSSGSYLVTQETTTFGKLSEMAGLGSGNDFWKNESDASSDLNSWNIGPEDGNQMVGQRRPDDIVTAAAKQAQMSVDAVIPDETPGWLRGIFIHSAFRVNIEALREAGFPVYAEVSYRDGQQVSWSLWGSVRADAIYGNPSNPQFIYELKTGGARMSRDEYQNYIRHAPPNSGIIQIVRP